MVKLNVNRGIRAREVRVIDGEGNQLGVMPTFEAIKKAEESGLDLVEVAPTSNPPVCRIMDYGKYKYEQSKKLHNAKLHSKTAVLKEIKLRPYTDTHDLEIKIRHSRNFLEEGNKVKVALMFRGRENVNQSIGRALMNQFMEKISLHGTIEQIPRMEGNTLVMIVIPKSEKGKGQKAPKPPKPPKVEAIPKVETAIPAEIRLESKIEEVKEAKPE
ncbi:MAG: translation initiation factor IF-3 [Nitrospirae bacterium]|nr:translation initiation factor IF-3 [Nitrospirota bacterium]